jgi:fused signal recognition particle receptor
MSPPLALALGDAVGIALAAAFLALLVAAGVRLARKRSRAPRPTATPTIPTRGGRPAAPTETARGTAPSGSPGRSGPAEPDLRLEPRSTATATATPAAVPSETAAAREEREARRKEEYRLKKEAERAEKERKARERAEAERLAREEEERKEREAEEARRREEEERRRRAEAEAGKTLAAGLERTRSGFMARLGALLSGPAVDEKVLAELEEVLFTADIGVKTASALLESARERVRRKELSDPERLKAALREGMERILDIPSGAGPHGLGIGAARPWTVMVVGVNGSGKTTTIGKLAAKVQGTGRSVLLGAGDTFRAAAGEQLEIWAERVGAPVVRGKEGSDPASVCFEAVKEGVARGVDVVICDTAGRLHTKAPLMEELRKVKRVMGKAAPGAPHEVLLVLDATNGQNAIAQARQFHEALGVTGLVLTKLDGTAKGGVVLGICDELRVPVRFVGVGEKVADLRAFDPREFVAALFGE